MFDEFLEEYKYNWKMADKQYTVCLLYTSDAADE